MPQDCDDQDPDVHPGVAEQCDGRDEDCSGVVDDAPDGDDEDDLSPEGARQ